MNRNYWSTYDTPGEGCLNQIPDLFCDSPYNVTNFTGGVVGRDFFPYIIRDGWQTSLIITNLILIQVVRG